MNIMRNAVLMNLWLLTIKYSCSHVKKKVHSFEIYVFTYQDIIKSSGPWQVLKLGKYNLR